MEIKINDGNKKPFDTMKYGSFFIANGDLFIKTSRNGSTLAVCLSNDCVGEATKVFDGQCVKPVSVDRIEVTPL